MAAQKLLHGSLASIGTSALQFLSTSTPVTQTVEIKASPANSTGIIYIGNANVTAGVAAPTTDGFPLAAGERLVVSIDDVSKLYAIGSTTSLSLSWTAQ